MPELPEVETVRQTLKNFELNQKIENIVVYYDNIVDGDTDQFITTLKYQSIIDIKRIGKYMIFELENNAFVSHLRMEGKYYYVKRDEPVQKHCHLIFQFDNGMDLRYYDVRKFGRLQLVDKMNYQKLPPLNKLGKEPFDLSGKEFYKSIISSQLPIKTVLLDQTTIAGLGNIYANEVLFRCKIHPRTKASNLSLNKCQLIIEKSIEVLNEAISQGGTTIRSFSSNGIHGLFTQQLNVHGKYNEPCPCCGKPIYKRKINGRSAYYCTKCQKIIYK